jgi:predicted permease
MEQQLDKELAFHVEQHEADLVAQGWDPQEARRQARVAVGGPEQVKEMCRDARGTRWLDDLMQDIGHTIRTLRQRATLTAVVVFTLALGAGTTTIMFTVINGVLLKPLPFPDPGRLVTLTEQTSFSTQYGNRWAFAYPNYLDLKQQVQSLTLAAWCFRRGTVSAPGEPAYVDGREISSQLFSLLGIAMVHGRQFLKTEDQPGGPPVAIISHRLWQRHYGGRVASLTEPLIFDGKPYTVVGVVAPGLTVFGGADVFTLIGQNTAPPMRNRGAHPGIQVWGRLKPDVTPLEAQSELTLIGRRLAEQYPESNKERTFLAEPLRPLVGHVASTLWLLLGAVGLVLLIACANIASLLLALAVARDREMAMRAALGARRSRLMRQCLTESAVLGLLGGTAGVIIALLGVRPFVAFWPGGLPRAAEIQIDGRVLLFALGVSLTSGVVFGLAPALRVPARGLEQTLRAGARTVSGRSRLHGAFVIAEIATALVLLACAGVFGRALLRLSSLDAGLDTRNVLVTRMALSPSVLTNPAAARSTWDNVLARAKTVPGVKAITLVDTVPMREGNNQLAYWTSAAAPPPEQLPLALATSVTADYLNVMGIPLRQGRFFDDRDRMGAMLVVVIDEVLAQQAFAGENPVGKRLWVRGMGAEPVTVIGVVGHVRHWGFAADDQASVRAQLYYPFAQVPDGLVRRWSELMSIAVRTTTAPQDIVESLRRELRGANGDQVLYEVRTLDELAGGTLARQRFLLLLFGVFAGVSLLLAGIGTYGVLAYLTSQRIPEFGVRMALGASTGMVMRLVLSQSVSMITAGIVLGTFAALAAARILDRLVDGVGPVEFSTLGLVISVLVATALLASVLPARRASLVDAMTALRQQ